MEGLKMWDFSVRLVIQDEVSYCWITSWNCRMFVIEHCVSYQVQMFIEHCIDHQVQIQNVCGLGSQNCLKLVLSVVSCHNEALVYVS